MRSSNRELWLALCAVVFITLGYLYMMNHEAAVPAASNFYGHMIGVLGFFLMLMTETLYTLRKRSRLARWGRTASWLRFHIFTGIVGPFMVLLHSSWKVNGLAGVTLLLTVVIVASGFIGRYIYTSIPRSADGIEMEAGELEKQISRLENEINQRSQVNRRAIQQLSRQRKKLGQQVNSLAMARRLLSLWHAVHIPIGLVLFTLAFIHALAAFYYATLLH
jgi:hypothetical protein